MKILIDIDHPAHVHYFKNLMWIMQKKKHKFLITARDRKPVFDLLSAYNFNFIDRGTGSSNVLGKVLYTPKAEFFIYRIAKRFRPDLLLSIRSIYMSHVSKLLGIPYIAFGDTETIPKYEALLSAPFTDVICTPNCFRKDLGKKQIRYKGYHELAYLHPNYFEPDPSVLDESSLSKDDKFTILRFVAWQASHDINQKGFNLETKRKLVRELEKYGRVLISSEKPLPKEFEKYRIAVPPERIHNLLYYTTVYVGEGATMATESAILCTPSIFVNSSANVLGNFIELEQKYGLIFNYHNNPERAVKKTVELIQQPNLKQEWQKKREKLLIDKIDVTAFMTWFIENYPESFQIMKENPDYQERFK